MSATPPRDLLAMAAMAGTEGGPVSAEALGAQARTSGLPVWQIGIALCRAKAERAAQARGQGIASGVWRRLSPELRGVLLTVASHRADPMRDAAQAWGDFTDAEKMAIGAAAREWGRQLERAAWLR